MDDYESDNEDMIFSVEGFLDYYDLTSWKDYISYLNKEISELNEEILELKTETEYTDDEKEIYLGDFLDKIHYLRLLVNGLFYKAYNFKLEMDSSPASDLDYYTEYLYMKGSDDNIRKEIIDDLKKYLKLQ